MLQSKTRLYLLSVLTFLTFMDLEIASAAWNSSISFTTEERDSHVRQIQKVIETASSCLDTDLDTQQRVYQQYGVSPFYGDRSFFGKLSYEDKFQELYRVFLEKGYREKEASLLARHFRETMEPTSCVGLVLKCLGRGFKAAGQADLWARIRAYTDANGSDGTSLQNALQMLGWRVLYWNP